jgi:hypothetical protein
MLGAREANGDPIEARRREEASAAPW